MPARETLRLSNPLVVLGGLTVFAPLIDGGTTHLPVLIIRLVLLAALTAWILASMRSGRLVVQRSRLLPLAAVFVGWSALSVIRSAYTAVSLQWLVSIVSYAVMLVLILHLLESVKQVWRLAAIILGMGCIEAAVGIYQFLWAGQARATGTFFNPNFFAMYEAVAFAVAFGLLCFPQRGEARSREILALWSAASLTAVGFILAQSRGALVAFVAAVGVVGLYRFGKRFVAVLVAGLIAGALVPNPLQQRVLTVGATDPYAYTRLAIWKNSLERIADHPWGAGLGLYKYLSFRYRFPIEDDVVRFGKRAESSHNEYLQMAVEIGVVGLALFIAGAAVLGWEIREALAGPLDLRERGLIIGLTGGIVGILVHATVDAVFHEPALVLLMVLCAGMILGLKRLRGVGAVAARAVAFPSHPARVALIGVLVMLSALVVIRPAAAWHAFDRGKAEDAVGQADRALEWYAWAARIDPGVSTYHDAVASAEVALYRRTGDPSRLLSAEREFRRALELNPLDARPANRLGGLLLLLADRTAPGPQQEALLQQAAAAFTQAIQRDPYAPYNYLELGNLQVAFGRVAEAEGWFRQALRYEPNFLPVRVRLAELALSLGRREQAVQEYREMLAIKARYRGRVLTPVERQYLDVPLDPLAQSLAGGESP